MLSLLLLMTTPADACGGFFCDNAQPVLQNAERIVFGIEDGGNVEMHVQIAYEGPSEDFAWIVPTPAEPELFVTTSALFTQLSLVSQPRFFLQTEVEGTCRARDYTDMTDDASFSDGVPDYGSSYTATDAGYDVSVIGEKPVGPYDTVVLSAASVEDLTGWLGANGYDIPAELEPVLEPYLAAGNLFVALKLQKDRDTGDLTPLGMTYAAEKASIPVQLTSVAATPDMRLEAYVLGGARGVPESYLHVGINDAAIDWWTGGSNYADVITQAADEAGGQAFATDFAGSTERWASTFDTSGWNRAEALAAEDPFEWSRVVLRALRGVVPAELGNIVENHVALPEGVSGLTWIQYPEYFGIDPEGPAFDVVAATLDVEAFVIEPMGRAFDLVNRHATVSRMTSSISPVEMTVDPVFALNADMPQQVSEQHNATLVFECSEDRYPDEVLRRLELEDGRVLMLPPEAWMNQEALTDFEYLQEHRTDAAMVIERTGGAGNPEPLTDHRARYDDLADAHNASVREVDWVPVPRSCGCTSSGGGAGLAVVLAGGLLAWRRRQS